MAPFSFLAPDHPLAPRLERFRAAIAARAPDVDGATVHTDLTLLPDADGGLVLHRAYWSAQRSGADGFDAATLDYHATRDRARWLAFPDDPELPALGDITGDVLRYMPLEILDAELIRRAGQLHRAMYAAHVPGVPAEDPAEALAELRADAWWVAFALPEHADTVRGALAALERHPLDPPRAPAFCHGDLVPSQMLVGERWAITDFDGARIGDTHRDLATWLASLTSDVPALAAADDAAVVRAEAAYLDGYGAHDERRLRWHRAAAEIHSAAVALKKDRHDPARLARALDVARACAQELG